MDPPLAWANLDDCGTFPCTAPLNALLNFRRTSFVYTPGVVQEPVFAKINSDFQLLGNNSKAVGGFQNCKYYSTWNGHYCEDD